MAVHMDRTPLIHRGRGRDILNSNVSLISALTGSPRQVWVQGHSMIYWVSQHAKLAGWGQDLCLEKSVIITWLGLRGMWWDQLMPLFWHRLRKYAPTDALLFHVGENNLRSHKGLDLTLSMKEDLQFIHVLSKYGTDMV